ncbi:MAG: NAD-dependent epimerase/dehydratase family protein [Staphylococcus equorum]|uniref:NAD-dependent epimerase/dehydratase family protein n=1 Tax=Tetragenococcus halophilus TaxID=51669 RepID=UPI001929007A|nr:NAD-dependent epimerase/dehydratase family protein [Tetragenococcus halophilus]MDN6166933.1 NAD-dependent epimerase/dehydratase family protein [Tetragenococcus koreensis]MDN6572046.1 NAD-dependent epimerase/dehydratase family protein [Staphylococcus equorum]MDN6268638.1 NAD-dependent epimerase/dehydratase family protein [Tetragenococcus koreensis]MDN6735754.1 NAD-dependent epimerase/dehydratase family protein [Tetragenococcus koreensis]MDN6749586.1 NAD-dependent epimerase/dehydratase family
MNYLITGGAGFIGSSLANYLVDKGHSVTVIDDLSMGKTENIETNKITFINADVRDLESMNDVFQNNQFDYIFLLAAIASVADSVERPIETHNVNFESILYTLELARKTQKNLKRILFTSSAAVYGDEPTLPKKEESVIRPLTPYAIDKFAAEKYTLLYNNLYELPTSAVRFFNVYGLRQNPASVYSGVLSIISKQFTKLLNHEKVEFNLYGDGEQTRDFVYINDVIDALLLVAGSEESKGEVYNIGAGQYTSLNEVINVFEKISGVKLPVNYLQAREGDIKASYADISKLVSLGYRPNYNIYKGIEEYFSALLARQ